MVEDLFNRHSVVQAGACASAADCMIFAWEERRLFEGLRVPLRTKNSTFCRSPLPDYFPKLRLGNPAWDSTKRSLTRAEDWKLEKLDCSQCSRNDSQIETRKSLLSPLGLPPPKRKSMEDGSCKDPKHLRSVSVEPSFKQAMSGLRKGKVDLKLTLSPVLNSFPGQKGLQGKAATLNGRRSKNEFCMAAYNQSFARVNKENAYEMDSPVKKRYKRLLQLTSKAMEMEHFTGWDHM